MISVIVTHHLRENQAYLDLCLKSVLRSTDVNFEVICVSDAEVEPTVPVGVRLIWDPSLSNATRKVHHAIEKIASNESQYFMLLSDDTIVSQRALFHLREVASTQRAIVGALSNNDNGVTYRTLMGIARETGEVLELSHQMSIEDISGWEDDLMNYPATLPIVMQAAWIAFYGLMLSRSVWEEVGLLDERLDRKHNDQDYCYRAKLSGILSIINLNAFIFHFGGKTMRTDSIAEREASQVFIEKWRKVPCIALG